MGDERFDIPPNCRDFDAENLERRLEVARGFVAAFVANVAPQRSLDHSNKEWTRSIRRRLKAMCPNGCYMCPPDPNSSKGEFLVDFVWGENSLGQRILLAGESEWATDRYGKQTRWSLVEEDFEKLLSVKASFKVLVFSSDFNLADFLGALDGDFSIGFAKTRIKASLEGYGHHLAGEVYIFVDFPATGDPTGPGLFRSFIWQVKKFGAAGEVVFVDGPTGVLLRR
ncbi:MAG: hypothetical protein ABSF28_26845 [Terracidiphilus sp.]